LDGCADRSRGRPFRARSKTARRSRCCQVFPGDSRLRATAEL
jgi:hypothetical protein